MPTLMEGAGDETGKQRDEEKRMQKAATTMKALWLAKQPADIRQMKPGQKSCKERKQPRTRQLQLNIAIPNNTLQQHFKHGQCCTVCANIFLSTVFLHLYTQSEGN